MFENNRNPISFLRLGNKTIQINSNFDNFSSMYVTFH